MEITNKNFEQEVLKENKLVIVDFYATWCGPCMMIKEVLKELEEKNKEIKICKINVDNEQELAIKFGVMSIPTVYFFKNGEVVDNFVGYKDLQEIEEIINKHK